LLALPKGMQNEAAFLHFAEERGRLNVDIMALRKQKRQLETVLRDFQLTASQNEEKLRDELSAMNEQMAEAARQVTREGANIEYLKNVLLKFLTSMDSAGKQKMLKALMTILQFSPQEKEQVKQVHVRGWWPT
jgi:molecular chaperone GrpE (heat shock protein)